MVLHLVCQERNTKGGGGHIEIQQRERSDLAHIQHITVHVIEHVLQGGVSDLVALQDLLHLGLGELDVVMVNGVFATLLLADLAGLHSGVQSRRALLQNPGVCIQGALGKEELNIGQLSQIGVQQVHMRHTYDEEHTSKRHTRNKRVKKPSEKQKTNKHTTHTHTGTCTV
jgi:hypothetical protein